LSSVVSKVGKPGIDSRAAIVSGAPSGMSLLMRVARVFEAVAK